MKSIYLFVLSPFAIGALLTPQISLAADYTNQKVAQVQVSEGDRVVIHIENWTTKNGCNDGWVEVDPNQSDTFKDRILSVALAAKLSGNEVTVRTSSGCVGGWDRLGGLRLEDK